MKDGIRRARALRRIRDYEGAFRRGMMRTADPCADVHESLEGEQEEDRLLFGRAACLLRESARIGKLLPLGKRTVKLRISTLLYQRKASYSAVRLRH